MPLFSFALTSPKTRKKKTANNIRPYQVKAKGMKGVVFITIDAKYYVVANGCKYNILSECYSCKGIASIYRQAADKDMRKMRYIRYIDKYTECNPLYWLPFAAGCVVIGDIVQHKVTNTDMFRITKCYNDPDDLDAHNAYEFYRKNFKIINDIIVKKQRNGE